MSFDTAGGKDWSGFDTIFGAIRDRVREMNAPRLSFVCVKIAPMRIYARLAFIGLSSREESSLLFKITNIAYHLLSQHQ